MACTLVRRQGQHAGHTKLLQGKDKHSLHYGETLHRLDFGVWNALLDGTRGPCYQVARQSRPEPGTVGEVKNLASHDV